MINRAGKFVVAWFVLVIIIILVSGCSSTPYIKVGAGLKVQESVTHYYGEAGRINMSHPITARIEVGIESDALTYGVSHHSQWFTGFPFNNDKEYSKTELFVDYTWRFELD